MHTYMHNYIHAYTHIHIQTYTPTCARTYALTYAHIQFVEACEATPEIENEDEKAHTYMRARIHTLHAYTCIPTWESFKTPLKKLVWTLLLEFCTCYVHGSRVGRARRRKGERKCLFLSKELVLLRSCYLVVLLACAAYQLQHAHTRPHCPFILSCCFYPQNCENLGSGVGASAQVWRKGIARSPQGRLWQARSCPAGAQPALRFAASIYLGAWPHWVRYNRNIASGDFRGWSSSRQREAHNERFRVC